MEHELQDDRGTVASFYHPNNITVGKGRVLWARETTDTSGMKHPEGWALPGGRRTNNSVTAHAVASSINQHAEEAV